MRNFIRFTALGAALMAGSSLAHAQTIITGQPVETVIAQQPGVVVTQPAPAVAAAPLQTVETVRTIRSTTTPRRRIAGPTGAQRNDDPDDRARTRRAGSDWSLQHHRHRRFRPSRSRATPKSFGPVVLSGSAV